MGKLSIANLIIARRWLVLVTASMGLYLVLPDRGLAQNDQGMNGRDKVHDPTGAWLVKDSLLGVFSLIDFDQGGTLTQNI